MAIPQEIMAELTAGMEVTPAMYGSAETAFLPVLNNAMMATKKMVTAAVRDACVKYFPVMAMNVTRGEMRCVDHSVNTA